MLGTQEHHDLMDQFERDFKLSTPYRKKEDRAFWRTGNVYCHGETNRLFQAYSRGYAYRAALAREAARQ